MPAGVASATVPSGFISFCMRFADQCATPTANQNSVALSEDNWLVLNDVNAQINASISPEDDKDHYGRAEYWTIPADGRGDCEDYALAKRQALIKAGLPELALRMAVVLTSEGERHAVLTVTTDQGDYVLDNLTFEIRPWFKSGLTWIARQDSTNPWNWVALQPADPANQGITAATIN